MAIIWLQVTCFVFLILLNIFYFSKKRLKSLENKIFKALMIVNLFGHIIELSCFYTVANMDVIPTINLIVSKGLLVYYLTYILLFSAYVFVISYNKENKEEQRVKRYYKGVLKFCLSYFLVSMLFIIILPIEYHNSADKIYSYGMAVDFMFIVYTILIILWIICIFRNIKNLKHKKFIPLFGFIVVGTVAGIAQKIEPSLLVMTAVDTLVTFLLYFTIENPDLLLLSEFHKQREFAQDTNKEKVKFLFDITSKIKNPINSIDRLTDDSLNCNDIDQIKDNIRQIKNSNSMLSQFVNNVLDISDVEKKKIGIKKSKYHVLNIFNFVSKLCEKNVSSDVEYRFRFDNSIPEYLYGDSIRIKQILNILLENALEYTENGFIELSVNSITKNDICRLIITVEDSGTGINSDELNDIFNKDKMYSDQVLKVIDDSKNNLAVLKSIVNLMNGYVMVDSEYGKGTKFTIVVDQLIEQQSNDAIETVKKYEEIYENKSKILLVTDNDVLIKKIIKYVKKLDVKIELVAGGQACLELARANKKFDLIIMAENLPKLSSLDTLMKLKSTNSYKTPVLLITKNKLFGYKDKAIEQGFSDLIYEPLKKEQLLSVIMNYIEKKD